MVHPPDERHQADLDGEFITKGLLISGLLDCTSAQAHNEVRQLSISLQ